LWALQSTNRSGAIRAVSATRWKTVSRRSLGTEPQSTVSKTAGPSPASSPIAIAVAFKRPATPSDSVLRAA